MEYIHVKNLEKFHPGYKDRTLQWAKIYINMADGDPDTEMIENEIDWARLIKMILLELRAKKPLPNSDKFWIKKGFDLKKRSMLLTLQVLHNFVESVTNPLHREEKIREDKEKMVCNKPPVTDFIESLKTNKAYSHINLDVELGKMDAWLSVHTGRQKTKRFIVNWLNKIEKPLPISKPRPAQEPYKAPVEEKRFNFVPDTKKLIAELSEKKGIK